jgi:hypothetical protein
MYSITFQNPTAVNDIKNEIATIYPNPTTSNFTLKGAKNAFYQIDFYTINGMKVKSIQSKANESINISSLASNIYILKVTDQHGDTQYSKLIKE